MSKAAAVEVTAVIDEAYASRSNITILSPLFSVFAIKVFNTEEYPDWNNPGADIRLYLKSSLLANILKAVV